MDGFCDFHKIPGPRVNINMPKNVIALAVFWACKKPLLLLRGGGDPSIRKRISGCAALPWSISCKLDVDVGVCEESGGAQIKVNRFMSPGPNDRDRLALAGCDFQPFALLRLVVVVMMMVCCLFISSEEQIDQFNLHFLFFTSSSLWSLVKASV